VTSNLYYAEFAGRIFVIQAESEAVENEETAAAILREIRDLIEHGIRVVFVFGKGDAFERRLRGEFAVREHPETSRLVVPQSALFRFQEERRRIVDVLVRLCREHAVPSAVLPTSAVEAERRIGHGSTGTVTRIDHQAIQAILALGKLAIVGFGGEDVRQQFLQVPSVSLSADLAVGLEAEKLLLLTRQGGIFVPDRKGGRRQLSFADLEELLCLLQKKDEEGRCVLSGAIVPKVHASIRAVAGGVGRVHIVSYAHLLDEILTHTGVGTMIERHQSHHVDYARSEDLDDVERLHAESQRYVTGRGTSCVKPKSRAELEALLPRTLLLKHLETAVGKLHATEVPGQPDTLLIGGFVIAENHQDSQQGQLLLSEALSRFREQGYAAAAAITASERAKRLFERNGRPAPAADGWQARLLAESLGRYHPDERSEVQLFELPL
jgi:acetylglutamate kinase